MSKFIALTLLLSAAGMSACGKDDPVTAIDRSMDCSEICGRYKDCIQTDYDTDKCEDRCTDMVDSKETDKIDDCENCIDDKSCTNSVFNCTTECAGIVP
jgi:hypothetical protein